MEKQVKKLTQAEQDTLAAAINTALEIEMAFKLYSYRVATPEQFMTRVADLCDYFKTQKTYSNVKDSGETEV